MRLFPACHWCVLPAMCRCYNITDVFNFLDNANRRITRQMLKSKTGEFDVSSIHTLHLSDHGGWVSFPMQTFCLFIIYCALQWFTAKVSCNPILLGYYIGYYINSTYCSLQIKFVCQSYCHNLCFCLALNVTVPSLTWAACGYNILHIQTQIMSSQT